MATFLDLGLVSTFGSIFIFLLVWVVVYGILGYVKVFGEGKNQTNLNAIIALASAALVLLSKNVLAFVSFVVPWYLVLAIVMFMIIFVFRVFGVGDKTVLSAVPDAKMWIIFLSIIILLFGFGAAFGQSSLNKGSTDDPDFGSGTVTEADNPSVNPDTERTDTSSFSTNVYNTLFHPKVLGLIMLLLVGILALVFLTSN